LRGILTVLRGRTAGNIIAAQPEIRRSPKNALWRWKRVL